VSTSPPEPSAGRRGIAGAAAIIALGQTASRVLGLVREAVIAHLFGAAGLVSVFRVASIVPTMIYELLVGGMLSAALVPVFSQVEEQQGRPALWALFSRVISLIAVVLAGVVLLVELLAPQVAWLLGGGFAPELQRALVQMIRIITPAVLFFGISGAVTGLLYALRQFTYPAFAAAVFNLGIVVAAPLLVDRLGAFSLPVGVLLGSLLQLLVQAPGLRGVRLRPSLNLSDPTLRHIFALYLPIALGVIIANVQIGIDRRLASATGPSSIAWMANATTLFQLAHGLVGVAVAQAVLPTLSRLSAVGDEPAFRRVLGQGLRLVLVLIVPATFGLWILARPAVALLFEHGEFKPYDTFWVTQALRYYLIGLVFAAVDWPLNFAFYARHNTLTPNLVGVLSVGVYLIVALLLIRPMGFLGLVLADSAKQVSHCLAMLYLTHRRMGGLAGLGLARTAFKALLAAGLMAGLLALALGPLSTWVRGGTAGELLSVAVLGGLGALAYLGLAALLRVEELGLIRDLVRRRRHGPA
jgi:putative peptidoglycan lipid II flippase